MNLDFFSAAIAASFNNRKQKDYILCINTLYLV